MIKSLTKKIFTVKILEKIKRVNMKKHFIITAAAVGMTGLYAAGNYDSNILNSVEGQVIQQEISEEKIELNSTEKKIIKDWFNKFTNTSMVEITGDMKFKNSGLIKNNKNGEYKAFYEFENKYKEEKYFFPVKYEGGLKAVIYGQQTEFGLETYDVLTKYKEFTSNKITMLFKKENIIKLNDPLSYDEELFVLVDIDSDSSINYLLNMYEDNLETLKKEYRNKKINLVFMSLDFTNQDNGLEMSAFVKEYSKLYKNIDLFLIYATERKNLKNELKEKYLKQIREASNSDALGSHMKEREDKLKAQRDLFISKIENTLKKDFNIETLLKIEKMFTDRINKTGFLQKDSHLLIFEKEKGNKYFYLKKID